MKKIWKYIKVTLIGLVLVVVLYLVGMATYHHAVLALEEKKLETRGERVEVDGSFMNIYIEGKNQQNKAPTIVLLSGSGVASPLYDYKCLYSQLTDEYKVAVVEKFGYGYADRSGLPRDIKTMVEQNRKALQAAGEMGPYVLMPHSMSALESIYWAQTYPEEVVAIIGLDMAVPDSYNEAHNNINQITFMKTMTFFGMHRIPAFCYVNTKGLTEEEANQNKYLIYKNSLNQDVYEECKVVYDNAKRVGEMGVPDIPILMFTTNLGGAKGGEAWAAAQDAFALKGKQCKQIKLECGHNLHYEKTEEVAREIKLFMKGLSFQ